MNAPTGTWIAGISLIAVLSFALVAVQATQAQTFTLLYSFTGGADGGNPHSDLILDANNNLYGTTYHGGIGAGTVFKLDANGKETVLHTFTGGAAGLNPNAGLTMDRFANLYGATVWGSSGGGTVFRLSRAALTWSFSILYGFTGGADGANPDSRVIIGLDGNLYGTTANGGTGGGVVYKLQPPISCHSFACPWKQTVLYTFTGGADGGNPAGPLVQDSAGNFYGTTQNGGSGGAGAVFKIDTNGKETVLYNFAIGSGGGTPMAGLIQDSEGNLYGTTYNGGYLGCFRNLLNGHPFYCGAVFKLDSAQQETVLHAFHGPGSGDGAYPVAPLIADPQGNLYGTTDDGGIVGCRNGLYLFGCGAVYEVFSFGGSRVMFAFPKDGHLGLHPQAGLLRDANGNLYGTTTEGGSYKAGTVFKLTP